MEIIELQDRNELFEKAIQVFWKEWGSEDNYSFYEDCMITFNFNFFRSFQGSMQH